MPTKIPISLCFILSLMLVACSSNTTPDAVLPGSVEVRITDHRIAIGDFDRLDIVIERISFHPTSTEPSAGWLDFEPDDALVDLTQVLDGRTETVLEVMLPAGDYDAVQLNVTQGDGDLKAGETVTILGFEQAARVPFLVRPDETIVIVIDIIVESQDDHPGGGYELNIANVTVPNTDE